MPEPDSNKLIYSSVYVYVYVYVATSF